MTFYSHYLASESVSDDDILVLLDAYDVVIYPAARRVGKVRSVASVCDGCVIAQ
jgi:hypothetical protein